jgi:hypothetical protein
MRKYMKSRGPGFAPHPRQPLFLKNGHLAVGVDGEEEVGLDAEDPDLADAGGTQFEDRVGMKSLANACNRFSKILRIKTFLKVVNLKLIDQ